MLPTFSWGNLLEALTNQPTKQNSCFIFYDSKAERDVKSGWRASGCGGSRGVVDRGEWKAGDVGREEKKTPLKE